jgi:electron transfer flavoprotein alpha subunit
MSTSGTIVAVNTDSGAPIGEFADLLVAANALEVAKELTKLVEAHRSA